MEKLPKIGIPVIILLILIIVIVAKSAVTIGSGEAGVLYKTFDNGVVTDKSALGEGFHIIAPWNKVFIYEVRQQEIVEALVTCKIKMLNDPLCGFENKKIIQYLEWILDKTQKEFFDLR